MRKEAEGREGERASKRSQGIPHQNLGATGVGRAQRSSHNRRCEHRHGTARGLGDRGGPGWPGEHVRPVEARRGRLGALGAPAAQILGGGRRPCDEPRHVATSRASQAVCLHAARVWAGPKEHLKTGGRTREEKLPKERGLRILYVINMKTYSVSQNGSFDELMIERSAQKAKKVQGGDCP